ncbi:ornithine cyclodeaminase [Cellulomonas alba]|uniref:Ornithine cyclodeaminase n=1 Tax=Cellulomonas alba TaxID=3053467 RepID=A0ABT7SJ74_9CELL|nr:ornithine cyclodeaminase [Cellulomonas alba]MDM7856240.1 ornithine cyclodeaminase [Cellulomonas alba]
MGAVPFLGVADAARWIARRGPAPLLAALGDRLERDLARWPSFELRPRLASHTKEGVVELMPTRDADRFAFKYVNGHPGNPALGLQTVAAFGVLADVRTGYPLLVAEMTLLTALRTAATSALAARLLARADASSMALVGTGAQAEFQALALRDALGVERVRAWDVDPAALAKFGAHARALGLDVVLASDVEDAVRSADVVTTCTADKRRAVVLPDELVVAGVHLNAIGGDCPGKTELDARTVARARVFVEHEPQTRVEGEIQQLEPDFPVTELWQVVTGRAPARTSDADVTLWDSVGFAVEDLTVLRLAYDEVVGTDLVVPLDLVAEPGDPKDLFGLVAGAAGVRPSRPVAAAAGR